MTTHKYYRAYKKLIRRSRLGDSSESPEYQILSKDFPHLAESIRLEGEKKRLEVRVSENDATKLRYKRKIQAIDMELVKLSLKKRIYGESKVETRFRRRLAREQTREKASLIYGVLRKRYTSFRSYDRARGAFLHRSRPPTIFDLSSLAIHEKGIMIREWIKQPRRHNQTK